MKRREFVKAILALPLLAPLGKLVAAIQKLGSATPDSTRSVLEEQGDVNRKTIFVNTRSGDDSNDGLSPEAAMATLSAALERGYTEYIYVYG